MNVSQPDPTQYPSERLFNGYYLDLAELRKKDSTEDFSFLEEEYAGTEISAYDFLHGYCFTFAIELARQFGYEIEAVKDQDLDLIHAYCVAQVDGVPVYIDIRGITNDLELFFEDFDDFVPVVNGAICKSYLDTGWLNMDVYPDAEQYLNTHPSYLWTENGTSFAEEARRFIQASPEIYDVERLRSRPLNRSLDLLINRTDVGKEL